jgi:hypothetical protein
LSYFAVFGVAMWFPLMGARVLGAGRAGAIVLGVGVLGVLTEWLAARLDYPFTLALVLWRDAPLLWVAGWVGVWGLSFLAWATNAALALAVMERRLNAPLKALAGGLLALHLLGWLQHALIREGETLRVAVVQWEGDYAPLIAQAKAQGAQLVVLPEVCCVLNGRGVALGAADAGVAHLRRIPRGQRGDACRASTAHGQRAVPQDVPLRRRESLVAVGRPRAGVPVAVRDARRGDLLRHDVHRAVSSAGAERRAANRRADF